MLSEECEKWLTRPLPKQFFFDAGKPRDNLDKWFKEIPDEYKKLAYAIIVSTLEVNNTKLSNCMEYRQFLFLLQKSLIEDHSIDLKLPYYWFMDGVMIEPEFIVRITNGIIGWRCDSSIEHCGREDECIFSLRL